MTLAELSEDPLFDKIPKDKIRVYIDGSINIARDKAAKLKKEAGETALIDICQAKGITVNMVERDYSVMNVRYRAEIIYDKKLINIMQGSINHMYNQLKDLNLFEDKYPISVDSIADIHVAHELYHVIEYIDEEKTGSLLPEITSFKIGRLEKKSEISKTSEAAAHIFCMELLNLPFHPKLLDYLYLLGTGEVTREKLLDYLEGIAKKNALISTI
jgi:hypothetical protein